jgi:cardiolipin synthase
MIPKWEHTVPNYMTLARLIVGIPLIVWLFVQGSYARAIALTFVSCISDWVDGWVARKFNQQSAIGAWLDPIVDKVLVFVLLATLFHNHKLAPDLKVLLAGLIVVQVAVALVSIITERLHGRAKVIYVGKVSMWFIMTSFGADMLYIWQGGELWHSAALSFSLLGLATSAMAFFIYCRQFYIKIKA